MYVHWRLVPQLSLYRILIKLDIIIIISQSHINLGIIIMIMIIIIIIIIIMISIVNIISIQNRRIGTTNTMMDADYCGSFLVVLVLVLVTLDVSIMV